jgi:hypothetical protein
MKTSPLSLPGPEITFPPPPLTNRPPLCPPFVPPCPPRRNTTIPSLARSWCGTCILAPGWHGAAAVARGFRGGRDDLLRVLVLVLPFATATSSQLQPVGCENGSQSGVRRASCSSCRDRVCGNFRFVYVGWVRASQEQTRRGVDIVNSRLISPTSFTLHRAAVAVIFPGPSRHRAPKTRVQIKAHPSSFSPRGRIRTWIRHVKDLLTPDAAPLRNSIVHIYSASSFLDPPRFTRALLHPPPR